MRSYLSQRTFRAILENKPYSHLRCRQRLAVSAPSRAAQCHCLYKIQRRYLFGFPAVSPTIAQPETKKGQYVDHGGQRMMELAEALEETSQSTPGAIAKAFSSFIQHRLENPTTITATQAKFLLWAQEYLDGVIKENQSAGWDQRIAQPEDILDVLLQSQWEPDARDNVRALAKLAFRKICSKPGPESDAGLFPSREVLYSYLYILASTGAFREALQVIENYRSSVLREEGISPWISVAQGALKKGPDALKIVFEHMNQHDIHLDQKSHEILTVAAANEMGYKSKYVYEYKIPGGLQPTLAATLATANAMIWHGKAGWARDLLILPRRDPTPEVRDAVLLLAVKNGQGADIIDKKLTDLCAINPVLGLTLTITTINRLLEFKVIKGEYDGIDDLISLAKKWGLEPDAFTDMSRVSALLHAGDIPGAMCLWEELGLGEITDGNHVTLWNVIMRQLCLAAQADPNDETVLAFMDRLLELDCRLEAATLEELCRMLLRRHDLEGISELLKPFVSSCSIPGLSQVLKPFAQFIADKNESVETAWEVHELLSRTVPYAPVEFWTNSMKQFFLRGRPDLGCLVFGHMRKKVNPQDRPTAHTYAVCFHGLAKTAYSEGIFLVHNMLKLDVEVQWTRTLLHRLMAAYIACGDPEQAMEFFRGILHSEEGPSYYSITLFFRACATYRKGLQEATQMVEKLKSLKLPLNRRAYNNYIRVLSTHGELERATEAVSAMRKETGEYPTEYTIGLLYNNLPNQKWRDQAESWAKMAYPDLWVRLGMLPTTVDEDGVRSFDFADRGGEGNSQGFEDDH
ncbi:hypothetical protein GX50_00624 [[Emmonsia] crescens]|uniref:Mitochondrial respiratory complex I chaperone n=1 Tax=[Emmonsia] crescens TaxID=73230 RepID=A0A2B7ZV12_9EURO|nr:hypothetical protein GX50_00624 [Emmonsia crescens]